MSYNHALAEKKFRKEWEENETLYRQAGMTDEQIAAIKEFDEKAFRTDRAYYEKTILTAEPENYETPHSDSHSDEYMEENWTEFIDDSEVYKRLMEVPANMRRAFYMNRVLGMSQQIISSKLSISQQSISYWIVRIAEILK